MAWRERRAPAKINLGLKILGKREDGFHNLESTFVPLELHDVLRLRPAREDRFSCSDPALPMDANNLVIKALRLWREESRRLGRTLADQPLEVELHKAIPAGAGLGGGSSDAAACLLLLEECLGDGGPAFPLEKLALLLGSDVPFFLQPQWMHVTGRGEVLSPISPFFSDAVLVVWPGLQVSTTWAYAQLSHSLTKQGAYASFQGSHDFVNGHMDPSNWPDNDFEPVIFAVHPRIGELKGYLMKQGARHAAMSGSGSAVFGLFDSVSSAKAVAQQLQSRHPVVVLTLPLGAASGGQAEVGEDHAHHRSPCQPAA